MENKKDIKIPSIQASDIYYIENHLKPRQDVKIGLATVNYSIFTEYMRHKGMAIKTEKYKSDKEELEVTAYNSTNDIIMVKFDYGFSSNYKDKLIKKYPENKEVINKCDTINKEKLRKHFYQNGFKLEFTKKKKDVNGNPITTIIEYVMLCRTTGAAKQGKCLFIKKELYKKAINFLTMGLFELIPDEEKADIVSLSAYAPLIMAHTYKMFDIPIDHIFVVKDKEISAMTNAVCVEMADKKDKKTCVVNIPNEPVSVKNTLWDGMGIMEKRLFDEIGDLEGFAYCRGHLFKSCLFPGNIQEYFKDHYKDKYETAVERDLLGRDIRVKDIKIIITENSIKWWKFIGTGIEGLETPEKAYKYWAGWMKKWLGDNECRFQIVKTGHKSKYSDLSGNVFQRESFQMNNSLPCVNKNKLQGVCVLSEEYYYKLRTNTEEFIHYLRNVCCSDYHIGKVLVALYDWNKEFANSAFFKKKRNDILNELKNEDLACGKLFQIGDNLTICGNPLALLMSVHKETIEKPEDEGCFSLEDDDIQCYTKRFSDGEYLAGFRSPHNSPNNIAYFKNVYPEQLIKYFSDLGECVIVVNNIGTDIQSRLNGMDMDSDFVMVTNEKTTVELAKKAYQEYPTIKNCIPDRKSSYSKNMLEYARMDNQIASSQYDIGIASDLAQIALSVYYDGMKNGADKEKQKILEDIVIIGSVLAQCSIDSSKKVFDVSIKGELREMKKQLLGVSNKYPSFLANSKVYHSNKRLDDIKKYYKIQKMNCPMDIIAEIIKEKTININKKPQYKSKVIPNKELINIDKKSYGEYIDYAQYQKIKGYLEKYSADVENLDKNADGYDTLMDAYFDRLMYNLRNINIKQELVLFLVIRALGIKDGDNIADHASRYLTMLYQKDKEKFEASSVCVRNI